MVPSRTACRDEICGASHLHAELGWIVSPEDLERFGWESRARALGIVVSLTAIPYGLWRLLRPRRGDPPGSPWHRLAGSVLLVAAAWLILLEFAP